MIPSGPDVVLRAIGTALAGVSIAFAGYMLAFGGGEIRVVGMDHLAIFAQPRGSAALAAVAVAAPLPAASGIAVDTAPTGSVAETPPDLQPPARPQIVAARRDRVWLSTEGKIVAAGPGEEVAGLGRIGAIIRRDGGWAVLDDEGRTLTTLAAPANGSVLFSRNLIFD
jgi:hypothetical protein